jgi:hypothetical protein
VEVTQDPLDALMAAHGAAPAAATGAPAAPAGGDPLAALMAQHGGQAAEPAPAANFQTANEKDASGSAVVRGATSLWQGMNTTLIPFVGKAAHAIAEHVSAPSIGDAVLDEHVPGLGKLSAELRGFVAGSVEGVGQQVEGLGTPLGIALTLATMGEGGAIASRVPALARLLKLPAVKQLQRAVQAAGGGAVAVHGADQVVEDPTALGKLSGLTQIAAGAAGVGMAARGTTPAAPSSTTHLTPPEIEAVGFADQTGVPLDAATRTGSRTFRAMQKRVANSIGGEGTAEALIAEQKRALTQVGGNIADQVHPNVVTPYQGGESARDAVQGIMQQFNTEASNAYGRLRTIEENPQFKVTVHTAPYGSSSYKSIAGKLAAGLESGEAPTTAELRVMRQIETEMDALPYQQGKLVADNPGVDSTTHYVRGAGGASVYHDILQAAPGTSSMSRSEVLGGIRKALEEGEWTNAARGAYEVAKARLQSGKMGPLMPSNTPLLGTTEEVALPIDLRQTKQSLAPIYQRLLREAEIAPASVQGGKGQALVALDRLMNGPDVAPASVVDGALSDLKSMARTDVPELRTTGQGIVAQAVKLLEPKLQEAVRVAGPEAVRALEEGRGNTQAKYFAGDVLRRLVGPDINQAEPMTIFRKLTAPKDSAVALLKKAQELAPEQMPKLGRAWLEQQMEMATAEGGFDKAARLQAEWQRLGPQTKTILFQEPDQRKALDNFFLLAKRIAENPNPSGTAHVNNVFNWFSSIGTYPAAKLLYTPGGAQFLARFMSGRAPATAQQLTAAARAAGLLEVATTAKDDAAR